VLEGWDGGKSSPEMASGVDRDGDEARRGDGRDSSAVGQDCTHCTEPTAGCAEVRGLLQPGAGLTALKTRRKQEFQPRERSRGVF